MGCRLVSHVQYGLPYILRLSNLRIHWISLFHGMMAPVPQRKIWGNNSGNRIVAWHPVLIFLSHVGGETEIAKINQQAKPVAPQKLESRYRDQVVSFLTPAALCSAYTFSSRIIGR
jgi:hypothetical protein